MFSTDYFIETFQAGKKYWVNSFVTDDKLKAELNSFVDRQTDFTKQMIKTSQTVFEKSANEVIKAMNVPKK